MVKLSALLSEMRKLMGNNSTRGDRDVEMDWVYAEEGEGLDTIRMAMNSGYDSSFLVFYSTGSPLQIKLFTS